MPASRFVINTLQPPARREPGPTGEFPAIDGTRQQRRRAPHHYLLMAIGWPSVLAIAVVLVLRWRDVDNVSVVALVALTPFVLAPLVATDIIAWFSGSTTLRAAAAGLTAACLFTVAPFDAVIGCGPSSGDDSVTIMTANLFSGRADVDSLAATIVESGSEVILFQETKDWYLTELARKPMLDSWSHRSNDLSDAVNGSTIWSRWPLSDVRYDSLPTNSSVQAVVESPHGRFAVASVHTASPTSEAKLDLWHRQFEGLETVPTDQPMVMGGDFNATEDHRPFRQLLDQGWTDVHDDKGCGLDLTWSSRRSSWPVMRLDHILVTGDFDVLSTEVADPGGSDHRPVISRIRFAKT